MTAVGIVLAALLCLALGLASYFHLLYAESLRIRPREAARSLPFFEETLRPVLNPDSEAALRQFAAAKQTTILLLAVDLAWLVGRSHGLTLFRLLEAVVLTTVLLVLFAYTVPHVLVTRTGGRWSPRAIGPARAIAAAVRPLLVIVDFSYSIADLGAAAPALEAPPTASENIEALMDAGQEEGLVGADDRKLIQSVVEFGDKTVREVMTPRPRIAVIESGATLEQLRQLLITEQYSRIPVYRGSIDAIIGFVHSRDMIEIDDEDRASRRVDELLRPVLLVPESKRVNDLLREMQEKSLHMSIVVDEYGNTAGLATLEDLVEEIVGEIRDEAEPHPDVVEEADHSFLVAGDLDLDRLEDLTGFRPGPDVESTTVAGLVSERLGHVPAPGESLQLDGIRIEVLAASGLVVEQVRVRRVEEPSAPADAA